MNSLKYFLINLFETMFRGIPIPCKTGLAKLGNPNADSPVFLTCNYHLTVARVKRALRGIDGYLLIANSHGHNVWCGSTGGHLNNHHVISVLKTSGIEELVNHKNLIVPQLAATGIETTVIHKKTGWRILWGPVYARDIAAFLRNKLQKTEEMRKVKFDFVQRIEMTVMWAFPFSFIVALVMHFFWREMTWPLTGFIWGLSTAIFLLFPLYSKWINPKKKGTKFSKYTVVFDFGRTPLILWGVFMAGLYVYGILTYSLAVGFFLKWSFVSLLIILLISLDLAGSTPVYKSGLHEDRFLAIKIDKEKCKGAAFCEQVCPKNCFDVDDKLHTATITRFNDCVQCGACIVQCPFDALYFAGRTGEILPPEQIRKFKLNLMGKRMVKI